MNWITPKNTGFEVKSRMNGFNNSQYVNEDINLDLVLKITKGTINNEMFDIFIIIFTKGTNWYYKDQAERDSAFFKIKSLLDSKEI